MVSHTLISTSATPHPPALFSIILCSFKKSQEYILEQPIVKIFPPIRFFCALWEQEQYGIQISFLFFVKKKKKILRCLFKNHTLIFLSRLFDVHRLALCDEALVSLSSFCRHYPYIFLVLSSSNINIIRRNSRTLSIYENPSPIILVNTVKVIASQLVLLTFELCHFW